VCETPRVKVYIAEEQRLLWDAYHTLLVDQADIDVIGSSHGTDIESLVSAASLLKPDVILLGFRVLQRVALQKLELIRESCPSVACVLLFSHYDVKGIKALRQLSGDAFGKCAYLLKHNINSAEDLTQVIHVVAKGQVVIDTILIQELVNSASPGVTFLKQLVPPETEVLNLMAKGYHNDTIANILGLQPGTVDRCIKSIYSKLDEIPEARHARVRAVTLYLSAAGLISVPQFANYR
jgi:DNA-binding NarL/FixJ family response regulator